MGKKIIIIFTTIVIMLVILAVFIILKATDVKRIQLDKRDSALGISRAIAPKTLSQKTVSPRTASLRTQIKKEKQPSIKTKTIALFGIDRREKQANSRSDLIMLLTIDYSRKKIKLSSMMRDLYVQIEGHGHTKLAHAYAYGGPQLAIKTLNQNFGLDISDFCTVDFFNMEKIVNKVGGIQLDIAANEIKYLNDYVEEMMKLEKKKLNFIVKPGLQQLDGAQAVSYSRIRYTGHGDFDRTDRQRKVLRQLLSKGKKMGLTGALSFANTVLPCIETSFTKLQIMGNAYDYFKLQPITVEEMRFPVDGAFHSGKINGIYYIKADMQKTKLQLKNFIYNDKKP